MSILYSVRACQVSTQHSCSLLFYVTLKDDSPRTGEGNAD